MPAPASKGFAMSRSLAPGATILVGVLLVAANLRPAFTGLGPVLPDIQADLALPGSAAALLTSLPVVALGALAPLAATLSNRIGLERAIALALIALLLSLLMRVLDGVALLVGGTIVAGGAIAIGNVLLPVIVKRDFSERVGPLTGLYTAIMSVTASLAAATTFPFGQASGLGWRGGLAVWALPVAVALVAWLPQLRAPGRSAPAAASPGSIRAMLADPLAWWVTLYLGLQSLGFYAVVAWLPSIYRDLAMEPGQAGLLASIVPLAGIAGAVTLPAMATRSSDQRAAAFLAAIGTAAGLVGIALTPLLAPFGWVALLGVCQGAGFPIALALIALRSRTPAETQQLSAMAQTIGYLVAALGPLLVGTVHDLTGGWQVPLALLAGLTVAQAIVGLGAGRARYVRTAGG